LISMALRWILTVQQVAVCNEFDALTFNSRTAKCHILTANMKVTVTGTHIFLLRRYKRKVMCLDTEFDTHNFQIDGL